MVLSDEVTAEKLHSRLTWRLRNLEAVLILRAERPGISYSVQLRGNTRQRGTTVDLEESSSF